MATLHAIALLATLVVPVALAAVGRRWSRRPMVMALAPACAFVGLGGLFALLLSARGAPLSEWLFPMAGAVIAGFCVTDSRRFQITWVALLLAAALLCVHAMYLRMDGYTSLPLLEKQAYQAREQSQLRRLGIEMSRAYTGDPELPEGPIRNATPQLRGVEWSRPTLTRCWHTSFTRLHRIVPVDGQAWYPGGPVSTGSKALLWKPKGT